MQLLEVAQAVTTQKLGPAKPNSIEISPAAMLLIIIGIMKGETRSGPLVEQDLVLLAERLRGRRCRSRRARRRGRAASCCGSSPLCLHRFLGRGHGELRVAVGAAGVLLVEEMLARLEVLHLRGEAAVVLGGVPRGDRADAAFAGDQVGPARGHVEAQRGDRAHAGDDDSPLTHS